MVPQAYQIAREFKKRGLPVVMGGAHASFLPEETLQYVDSVNQLSLYSEAVKRIRG